jgi:hypothetical protein
MEGQSLGFMDQGLYFVSTYNVVGAPTTPNVVPATFIYPCSGEVRPHTSPIISRSYP